MEQYIIKGGHPLVGEVEIGGAKNAALAILAAAIMTDETVLIDNLPDVNDINVLIDAIEGIGAKVHRVDRHTVKINGASIKNVDIEYDYIKKIRASYYLLGALLGKYKRAEVALPGGCNIGSRPIDQHLKGFRALGADVDIEHGKIVAEADRLVGKHIYFDVVSVGATIETDFYRENDGKYSIPVMRAMVLKEYFSKKTLYLGDGELIVGEKGKDPQASPTFPELCCHSVEDMTVMSERDLVSFHTTEEDRKLQAEEIIPFWKGRTMRERLLASMTPEWNDCYAAGMFTEFMEQRGPGHTCGGEQVFTTGYLDYKEKIKKTMDALDFMNDPDALDKMEELKAMDISCDAVIILGERYHELALELAEKEADPVRKEELKQIAANLEVVPAHAPQTYWQAIQLYWFTHLAVTTELNPWDAFSPGRLDQHLIKYYEADTEAGILDDERAKELLECLWVKFYNQPAPVKVGITLKESATYTDFANINTGGVTPDGRDGVNAVSYLILDCMDEMKLVQPNSNVTISKKTPARFLKRACEISRKGWGQPAFYNTEAQTMELINAGKSLEDARRGGSSGCVETGAWGSEAYILTGYLNIPKVFQLTLYNGFDKESGKQLGLKTGEAKDFKSYDELWDAFQKQLKHFIDIKIRGNNVIEKLYAENMPAPCLSVVTNDCISNAKDYN